jgi:hypothetical protein
MIKIGRPNLNDAPSWHPYFLDLEVPPSGGAYAKDFNAGQRTLTDIRNEPAAVRGRHHQPFQLYDP